MKIVSLFPVATDILLSLGCPGTLLACSHLCELPDDMPSVLRCTSELASVFLEREVDRTKPAPSKSEASKPDALIKIDLDLIMSLEPDLILCEDLADLCDASPAELQRELHRQGNTHTSIHAIKISDLGTLWQEMLLLARLLACTERADHLIFRWQQDLAKIAFQTWGNPLRVLFLEQLEPFRTKGYWLPELSEMAGVEDIFGVSGQPSQNLDFAELIKAEPDAVVLMLSGCDLSQTQSFYQSLASQSEWQKLRAVQTGQVYGVNARDYFKCFGSVLVPSLEILAEIFHTEHFDFGHKQLNWCRLESL